MSQKSTMQKTTKIYVNDKEVHAVIGENVAAVLEGMGLLNQQSGKAEEPPQRIFCGMGVCFECLIEVGENQVRACQTSVVEGMQIYLCGDADA